MANDLTPKQARFCEEYLIDLNATQAAIRAEYSEKTACEQAARLLANVKVQNYLTELMSAKKSKLIASQDEVLELLTSLARGEMEEEVVVTENIGDYMSEAKIVKRQAIPRDRAKALELLGKRYALFTDKIEGGDVPLSIVIEKKYE